MGEKNSKNFRTLDMYVRLCEGKSIDEEEEAVKFGVSKRSIQRDIEDIRAFLAECAVMHSSNECKVEYNSDMKKHIMVGNKSSLMSNSEVLAVSKILLESRAFTKKEIDTILKKLVAGCVPQDNEELVKKLILNEQYHYVELHHKSYFQDRLWEIGLAIQKHKYLEITYQKQGENKEFRKHIVQPVAIMFSEYYFYLNAYVTKQDEKGKYIRKHEYPVIFRIDRISECKETGETFHIEYANRFEEGEFRKRIQFMYAGELMKLQLKYTGSSVEAILDRLPTAKIVSEMEGEYIIEAEVYGKGIVMWLLSQGSNMEVLKPESLRQEMKETLLKMLEKY